MTWKSLFYPKLPRNEVILEKLHHWVDNHKHHKLIVAYSGGCDSHVLLHALTQIRETQDFALCAIHVNHGLQKPSTDWASHCQAICQQYQIDLQVVTLNLQIPAGLSLEAYARNARYEQFATIITEQDILLTAHTQSDQAETFLLQMLRGSGLKGLSSIGPLKPLGKGKLARPLLEVSRHQIEEYAKYHSLTWIEDPSNQDLRFRRNTVRKILLPMLKNINPNIEACIARSAKHCQEANLLLNTYVGNDAIGCLKKSSVSSNQSEMTLDIAQLKSLPELKQSYVLRHWLNLNGVMLPSLKKCEDILKQMLTAKHHANPCIKFGDWQLRRHQGCIYLSVGNQNADLEIDKQVIKWDLNQPIQLKDGSIWRAKLVQGKGIQKAKLLTQTLSIAYRQRGERVKLNGQTKSLKKILQTQRIPPWQRYYMPLFYDGNELLAVGTTIVCGQVVTPDEQGWILFPV